MIHLKNLQRKYVMLVQGLPTQFFNDMLKYEVFFGKYLVVKKQRMV